MTACRKVIVQKEGRWNGRPAGKTRPSSVMKHLRLKSIRHERIAGRSLRRGGLSGSRRLILSCTGRLQEQSRTDAGAKRSRDAGCRAKTGQSFVRWEYTAADSVGAEKDIIAAEAVELVKQQMDSGLFPIPAGFTPDRPGYWKYSVGTSMLDSPDSATVVAPTRKEAKRKSRHPKIKKRLHKNRRPIAGKAAGVSICSGTSFLLNFVAICKRARA